MNFIDNFITQVFYTLSKNKLINCKFLFFNLVLTLQYIHNIVYICYFLIFIYFLIKKCYNVFNIF